MINILEDSKWRFILKPIKDMMKNWDIDLDTMLDEWWQNAKIDDDQV